MRVRRRKTTRRRRWAPPEPAPEILSPPDLAAEIEQSVEARDRLEAMADRLTAERGKSEPDFLRLFAAEMRVVEIGGSIALERLAAWRARDTRAAQQIEALRRLSTMFKERVEQFKSNSKSEAVVALRRIVERLTAEREKPGADKNTIDRRIERLLAEQETLRAATAPVPPAPPKDKTLPPQRPAKSKPQPRERGGI
ncbi:MAG TPA: hypothetical protein VI479_06360 [Blastocatellia bacterium]